jgi:hypothetical protein
MQTDEYHGDEREIQEDLNIINEERNQDQAEPEYWDD